ncbi:tRNA preQ1(34) S-adenosylmethionine ribosyltransferase-isomerase QueA [Candidatus Saccharibacteria bacterium]|nr:tRNA preQ1(34) S-adenosylmethionine ribosyltransferase-isomerase QueA [Candidatus Saccharibacteria bacterium]
MLVTDFDYSLPRAQIAKHPPKQRGTTRLLVLNRHTGALTDSHYANLDEYLNPGDVIILNDTKVMQARIFCVLPNGHPRELVVLENHNSTGPTRVMYRGKLHKGDVLSILTPGVKNPTNLNFHKVNMACKYHQKILLRSSEKITVKQVLPGGIAEVESNTDINELTERFGNVPLPPYLRRDADADDRVRYQTLWAKNMGSAAAPTASLNMTDELLDRLKQKGVIVKYLTLHVGLGTFLPIRTDNIEDHKMHSEWYNIPDDTLEAIRSAKSGGHRVVALGTTVARTLEYYAKTGEPTGEDNIFIYPGYEFQIVDALVTNFHAPKSTVLMLAAAFAGWDHLKPAYHHALNEKYDFLSYGDSMFIC